MLYLEFFFWGGGGGGGGSVGPEQHKILLVWPGLAWYSTGKVR